MTNIGAEGDYPAVCRLDTPADQRNRGRHRRRERQARAGTGQPFRILKCLTILSTRDLDMDTHLAVHYVKYKVSHQPPSLPTIRSTVSMKQRRRTTSTGRSPSVVSAEDGWGTVRAGRIHKRFQAELEYWISIVSLLERLPGWLVANHRSELARCALIHRHRPDLLDWNSLDKVSTARKGATSVDRTTNFHSDRCSR